MDTVYLAGSEDVRSAGSAMREAAQQMNNAGSTIQFALERHQRFLDDWLIRFAETIEALKAPISERG